MSQLELIAKSVAKAISLRDAFCYVLELPKWDAEQPFFKFLLDQLQEIPVEKIRRALEVTSLIFKLSQNWTQETFEFLGIPVTRAPISTEFKASFVHSGPLDQYVQAWTVLLPYMSEEEYQQELEKIRAKVEAIGEDHPRQKYEVTKEVCRVRPDRYSESGLFLWQDREHNLFYEFLANPDFKWSLIRWTQSYLMNFRVDFGYKSPWNSSAEIYLNGIVPNLSTMELSSDPEGLEPDRFATVLNFTNFYNGFYREWAYMADPDETLFPIEAQESNGLLSMEDYIEKTACYVRDH